MTTAVPITPSTVEDSEPADLSADEIQAQRLAAEGWPALRGTPAQRDARFVKTLLEAQLSVRRRR